MSLNRIEILKLLIRRGANVNATDSLYWNGLHLAANDDLPEVARILLEAGTSPYAKNHLGQTPLDVARTNQYGNIVKLIERNGDAIPVNPPDFEPPVKLHPNQILPPSP